MGHDYSYSQPDSSDQYMRYSDDTEDREREALIQMDEAESNFINSQYPPQPEVEFGFPQVCYCGGQPLLSTTYNRRFFTCANVDDGEMHIHKWWDVVVMEEMREMDKQCEVLAEKVDHLTFCQDFESHISSETEVKIDELEKEVFELGKNRTRFREGLEWVVLVIAIVVALLGLLVLST